MVLTNVGDSHIFTCKSFLLIFIITQKNFKKDFQMLNLLLKKIFNFGHTFHGFISKIFDKNC
jgi:hypothetical protein